MTDWPQIIAAYGGIAWKTARRLLNNDADAADCFQETFVAAFVLSRTQTIQNWPGLVTRLATRRELDRLRKRKNDGSILIAVEEASEKQCLLCLPVKMNHQRSRLISASCSTSTARPRTVKQWHGFLRDR